MARRSCSDASSNLDSRINWIAELFRATAFEEAEITVEEVSDVDFDSVAGTVDVEAANAFAVTGFVSRGEFVSGGAAAAASLDEVGTTGFSFAVPTAAGAFGIGGAARASVAGLVPAVDLATGGGAMTSVVGFGSELGEVSTSIFATESEVVGEICSSVNLVGVFGRETFSVAGFVSSGGLDFGATTVLRSDPVATAEPTSRPVCEGAVTSTVTGVSVLDPKPAGGITFAISSFTIASGH